MLQQLKKLFSVMSMHETSSGETIAPAGGSDGHLYLIVSGVIEAMVPIGDDKEQSALSFSSGDIIGESVLFERKSWPADYKVSKAGTIFRLDREGLEKAMAGSDDPRHLLSVLRKQQKDRAAAQNVQRLRG